MLLHRRFFNRYLQFVMLSALDLWEIVRETLGNSPKKRCLDRKTMMIVQHLANVLRQFEDEELDVEEDNILDTFENVDPDENYDPSAGASLQVVLPTDPSNPDCCRIGDCLVPVAEVTAAVQFYGSFGMSKHVGKRRPSLSTVRKKFKFIKEERHLVKIAEFERKGVEINLYNAIKWVSNEMYKTVQKHFEAGHVLHDSDLRAIAMKIIKEKKLEIRFKASDSWINSWKRAHRVSSRRITKFVSRKRFVDVATIQQKSRECVDNVKIRMANYSHDQIFNGDQSGFVFEMLTQRTLANTGSKKVEAVVRSESNMKKSYTVLPLISANGTFAPKMFVVLKEPGGKFPAKGIFPTHNLVVKAYSTHMMTKSLMQDFFAECVFDPLMPDKTLLLVDSWPAWKDSSAIDVVKPSSKQIETILIPPGCTGMIQPLDVGIFGHFKKIMKHINAYAQRNHPDFHIAARDNILKVVSLVYWQISHHSLREWAKHAWFAAGYLSTHPLQYETPSEKLFPEDVADDCFVQGCGDVAFIRCLYCDHKYCFTDFVESYHKCV